MRCGRLTLFVLVAMVAGQAGAQTRKPNFPKIPPPKLPFSGEQMRNIQQKTEEFLQKSKAWQPNQEVPVALANTAVKGTFESITEFATGWATLSAIGAVLFILTLIGSFVIKARSTTDPDKLAANDPWIQSQIKE